MADPQFFKKSQAFTVGEIAKLSQSELAEGVDEIAQLNTFMETNHPLSTALDSNAHLPG